MNKFLASIFAFLLTVFGVAGADITIITFTVSTNLTDGDTITVNSDTRTFKDTVATPASQIEIGADIEETINNWADHLGANPFTSISVSDWDSDSIDIRSGYPGFAISPSVSTASITISTNTLTFTTSINVSVPLSVEETATRTNVATLLVTGLEDYAQNEFSQTSGLLGGYVSLEQSQSVSNKTLYLTTLVSPTTTNLVNYGNAISSPGSATGSEQIGTGASASGQYSMAVGRNASATNSGTLAIGDGALAEGYASVAIGQSSEATTGAYRGIAIGNGAAADGTNSIAIGYQASSVYANAIAIGNNTSTTADDQFRLGSSSHDVVIPGNLTVSGGITNSPVHATTLYVDASSGNNEHAGRWAWTRSNHSTLANGNNAAANFGDAVFVKIEAGPTAAFSINGIAGGADGRMLVLYNSTGYAMTIAHDSGVDPTPANRIYTMTGSDDATTGNGCATLIYDSEDSRWILTNIQP